MHPRSKEDFNILFDELEVHIYDIIKINIYFLIEILNKYININYE